MLQYFYEWIGNIAFYMVMVTAVLHLLPNSDYQKYIRFFTGLVLVILLITPVLKIFGMDHQLTDLYDSREYQEQMQRIEESSAFLEEIRPIAEEAEQAEEKKDGIQVEEIEIGK
nr:stage III sporulation protein AF [uncultured Merdimonas sp.]